MDDPMASLSGFPHSNANVNNLLNMEKSILFVALMLFASATAMARPAKDGVWKTLRLADGTEVRAELKGDEFAHFWLTEDGKYYVESDERGVYVPTTLDLMVGKSVARREAMTGKGQSSLFAPRMRLSIGGEHDPYIGEKKCLIILANFADVKFEEAHDLDYYTALANEVGFTDESGNIASVREYFLAQSYGQLDITFDVVGPVELEYGYAYYGGQDDRYAYQMIVSALAYAEESGIDFSEYDWDGDGEVDQVYVIYAGHGEADYQDSDTIWPHTAELRYYTGRLLYDGVYVNTYACSNELAGIQESGKADGIGAMCHEFSHCMGLPDMYDTGYSGCYGMAYWDVMDRGSYCGYDDGMCGYVPAGYTSYERMYCGWLDPIVLEDPVQVEGMKGLTEGGESYIIYNQGHTDEYYLLENRTPVGFDSELLGDGLLILHVDFSASIWKNNTVNTLGSSNSHGRCMPIPGDYNFNVTKRGIAGDTWPYNDNKLFDNYSKPAAEVYNKNSDGSMFMNISLSDITKAEDGSMSFYFYPAGKNLDHGNPPDGNIFYESFDYCDGTGGNDGIFGSSVVVGSFLPDNDGWQCSYSYGCDKCAFFGSNNNAASVVTPVIQIDQDTELSFRAAPFQAVVPGQLAISPETDGVYLSDEEFSIEQGDWTDCKLTIYGKGDVKLRIKETSGLNRFFLDEVAAIPLGTGISSIEHDAQPLRKGVYSLDGIHLGDSADGLGKGIYIIDGKKCVVR